MVVFVVQALEVCFLEVHLALVWAQTKWTQLALTTCWQSFVFRNISKLSWSVNNLSEYSAPRFEPSAAGPLDYSSMPPQHSTIFCHSNTKVWHGTWVVRFGAVNSSSIAVKTSECLALSFSFTNAQSKLSKRWIWDTHSWQITVRSTQNFKLHLSSDLSRFWKEKCFFHS